ncbi:MAG: hypothetical protein QOF62_3547 [Pyrinomonadaceae bacterium]|jgi:hypothetical protein|nr:hypothetical protein [Pyrinomonadaceae bacterium]
MKRSYEARLVSFLLLPLLVSTALSQQFAPTSEKELKRQRQRQQAISMVKQTAAEAPLWNDKNAAVQALADAADLLWDETPGQAAKWLRKAWDMTDQVSSGPRDEKLKAFFTGSAQSDLRTTVLNVARKHDPKLADEFLTQMSEHETNDKKERGAFDDRTARSEQLLSMAQQIVDSNAEEAFSLAAASLADGLSYKLQHILTSLRKKDVQLANRLFDLALAKFSSSPPDPAEAQILAGYLFRPGLTFSANSDGQQILVLNPAQQNLAAVASSEPQRAKSFLIAVYERLLTQPVAINTPEGKQRAQQILILGNFIARRYIGFAPELAPSAQGFLAQLHRQLDPVAESGPVSGASQTTADIADTTKHLTKQEFYEKNISELEDSADKESNAAFRSVAYAHAALATRPEDYVHAKRIAGKIDNDDLRADAVSFVLYRAALFFIEKAEIGKAIDISPTINDVSRRAVVRIAIAQRLLASKPDKIEPSEINFARERALDLLNDIDRDLTKQPSANAAKILFGRTAVLAKLDKDQALAALEQTVQMINKLDRFDLRDGAVPNLSLTAFPASGSTVARPKVGFDFRSAVEPLITSDFEQISTVVERLTAKELNGVGRLEVAKLYLQKTKDSSSAPKELSRLPKSH